MILLPYGVTVPPSPRARPRFGVAFLLTQLGTTAAERFALALSEHDLTPPLAGIMRMLRVEQDLSQQQLAERLGMAPSRVVSFVDDLESRGWVTRTRGTVDRRKNVLGLTPAGQAALNEIAVVSIEHEKAVTAPLDDREHATLRELLEKLGAAHGLTPGVHPGYQKL
jgi:DNA-binding MarR family transcriptional regulator